MNETTGLSSPSSAPFDTWAVLDFWLRRWRRVAFWTLLLAAAGALIARLVWGPSFTATAQLIHYAPSTVDAAYHPREIAAPSLVVMLQSPSVFESAGAQHQPPLSAKQLERRLQLTLDRFNDVATVTAEASSRDEAVRLVNEFTAVAIDYTRSLQKEEALAADLSVKQQLKSIEAELASSRSSVPAGSAEMVAAVAAVPATEAPGPVALAGDFALRLQTARERLDELLVSYTDAHPLVREQRARIASLEDYARRAAAAVAASAPATASGPAARRATASTAPAPSVYSRATPEEIWMGERLRTLETNRATLMTQQNALQPFIAQPPGYFSVLMPAVPGRALEHLHRVKLILGALFGAFLGFGLSTGQILMSEFLDNRVKTRVDVRRVTGLPLLATLGDINRLSPAETEQWAFRAWTALQRHLSLTPNHGMVCGITSAHAGDGRTTWINLLARAAGACGFRVLTITAQKPPVVDTARTLHENSPRAAASGGSSDAPPAAAAAAAGDDTSLALNANALSTPGAIAERLAGVDAPPMVNIPLPGWVWNLERRKQWQSALDCWGTIENVVIFVELPPASVPEAVLLAENIPNLLWLVDSDKSDAAEVHTGLETLRHARCNLVGSVLNRERAVPIRGRFSRWMGSSAFLLPFGFALLALGGFASDARATVVGPAPEAPAAVVAQASPAAPDTAAPAPETFSVVTSSAQRGEWQKRLTLGPGDVLTFHLFGAPELTREEVPVGPDGRVSYLEAENVMAAGLTVDELRAKLDEALGKVRRAPQTFVTPVAYHSKKYYVLGNVTQKGVFPLDRPITVIEAVARAKGFESGGNDAVEATDFSRSFVSRGGKRLPVDFEKLFVKGDLSQNVALEPDDYLYFPTGSAGQVYVLGEVRAPGAAPCDAGTSVLSVVAARGGFTDRAWTQRVLVVRGGMNKPELFKVDAADALKGRAANFALKAGDLVFVNNRPWIRGEELLDRAASAFVESAVITWTGLHVTN